MCGSVTESHGYALKCGDYEFMRASEQWELDEDGEVAYENCAAGSMGCVVDDEEDANDGDAGATIGKRPKLSNRLWQGSGV